MDFDDLDDPVKAPSKPSRFAPKPKFQPGAKQVPAKPKPEPEPKPEPAVQHGDAPPLQPPVVVKMEDGSAGSMSTELEPMVEDMKDSVSPLLLEDLMEEEKVVDEVVEEEDVIVAQYDVFLNPSDDDTQLYVLQYPLRPSWRPYELDQRCTEVRVRPSTAEMEVDMSIDMDSDNFDPHSPSADKMKKQTLSSLWRPPQGTGYAVGVLNGKKVYLNPIRAVVQLRPSMDFHDSGSSKKRSIPDVTFKADGSSSVVPAGSSRKQNQQMVPEEVESWIPLKYYSSTSDLSERYLWKMVTEENSSLVFPMNPYDYLNSLCPASAINKMKSRRPSKRYLLSLPLEERLKTWLVEGPAVQRFSVLKYLTPDDPDEHVLQVLQRHARLVQGHWVAKPLVRNPKAQNSEQFVRDYALLLFSQSPVVKDSKLDALGSQKSSAKAILREIAVERVYCKDWKFKEPTDVSFMKLYPHVVEEQRILWEEIEKMINEVFASRRRKIGVSSESFKRPEKLGKPDSVNTGEGSFKATNGAHSVKMSMSKETREALPKVLRKLFQTHKVCSFQTICQGLRDMAVSMSTLPKADARAVVAAALSVDGPPEELQAVINEVAVNVHGAYVLKSSLEHPEYNPFRNVVIEMFHGTGPNAKLKRSEIVEAAKIKLQREPTNTEFQKVITEICVSKGGAWLLKSADGAPK